MIKIICKVLGILLIGFSFSSITSLAQDQPFQNLKVLVDELELTPPVMGAVRVDGTNPPLYLYTDREAENFGIRRITFPNNGFAHELFSLQVSILFKNGGSTIPVSILDRDVKGFTTQIFAAPIVNLNNNTRLVLKYWATGY